MLEIERNCIASSALFLGAIVADALSATDPALTNESPTSLRCTAAVLIACLAAPPLRQRFVFEQRLVIGCLMCVVALTGLHEGSESVRVMDGLYAFLVLAHTLYSFGSGGIENMGDSSSESNGLSLDAAPYVYRESTCCLAASMLFYSGIRIVRQGIVHADVVRTFQVSGLAWDGTLRLTTGYAASSVATTVSLSFGGALCVGVSTLLFSSTDLRELGTSAKKQLLTSCAFLMLFAAFSATLAVSEQQVQLTAVWGASGCPSATCPAAGLARRNSLMNTTPMQLWINALGMVVLAYAPDERVNSREEERTMGTEITVWGTVSLFGCVAVAISYLSFTGTEAYVDYAVVLAIASIGISSFYDTWFGSLSFLTALGIDELMKLQYSHASALLTYFTHASLLVSFLLLLLKVLLSGLVETFWYCMAPSLIAVMDDAVGLITIAGTSITTALFLGTTALLIGYGGNWLEPDNFAEPDERYARTWAVAILEHWLPALLWFPLYFRKSEVANVAAFYRILTWLLAPVVPLIVWGVALASTSKPIDHAYAAFEPAFLLAIITIGVLPWSALCIV